MDTSLSKLTKELNNPSWDLIIYRVPTDPASKRVCIWRDFKRMGALSLQQCVFILPHLSPLAVEIDAVKTKIKEMGGEVMHIPVTGLAAEEEEKIVSSFRQQRNEEYQEILEECESSFVKEVEFERFRSNYTFEAVEEAEQNLEKIRRWYARIAERDWFHAELQTQANQRIVECQHALEIFEQEVYDKENTPLPSEKAMTEQKKPE